MARTIETDKMIKLVLVRNDVDVEIVGEVTNGRGLSSQRRFILCLSSLLKSMSTLSLQDMHYPIIDIE